MMKRLVATLFFLGLAALAVALVAPGFIDWNRYKSDIIARVSPYCRCRIEAAGDISLRLVPKPEVVLQQVSLTGSQGAPAAPFLSFRELRARVGLAPLLQGKVEVENITLVEPFFDLQVQPDGASNWSGVFRSAAADGGAVTAGPGLAALASAISLREVKVVKGAFNYHDSLRGLDKKFENLNISLTAATLLGPYRLSGEMDYQPGVRAAIDISSDVYDRLTAVPLRLTFAPDRALPRVSFNGVIDVQAGLDLQGELSLSGGSLAALFDSPGLGRLAFLRQAPELTAVMSFKGGQVALTDIKGRFGRDGTLQGKLALQMPAPGRRPSVTLDMEGSGLSLAEKSAEIAGLAATGGLDVSLHFKGKNVGWGGHKLGWAEITAHTAGQEWKIPSAEIVLPGESRIKLAGGAAPDSGSASLSSFKLATDNLAKLAEALGLAESNALRLLSDGGLVRKLSVSSSLEVSPARLSFFNLEAGLEGGARASGVLNISREGPRPAFAAKMNISDWNTGALPPSAWQSFLRKMAQTDAELELTFKNYSGAGDFRAEEMALRGRISAQGLEVQDFSGTLPGKSSFVVKGRLAGLAPLADMDLVCEFRAARASALLSLVGLPEGWLLLRDTPAVFSGHLSGSAGDWRVDGLDVKGDDAALSGMLAVKGQALNAEIGAGKVDLAPWLAADWPQERRVAVKLRAEDLLWQGQNVAGAALGLTADAAGVKVSDLAGTFWGGQLAAEISVARADGATTLAGKLQQADLNALDKALGLKGFSTGVGDLVFDLAAAKGTVGTLSGTVDVKTSLVTVKDFSFDKLPETVRQLTEPPENLQRLVDNVFRNNGAAVFKGVEGRFKLEQGRARFDFLKLSNAAGELTLSGQVNLAGGVYDLAGELRLKQPPDFPVVKIHRSADMADYAVDTKEIEKFIIQHSMPSEPRTQPPPLPPPPPPGKTGESRPPPASAQGGDAIGDILRRLDDGEVEPQAIPAPAPAQQPAP